MNSNKQTEDQRDSVALGIKLRILNVDDNRSCREYLSGILKEHYVVEAINGQEAVEKYNPLIDVVFMDIDMPVKDGTAATIEIKKNFPSAWIIAVTYKELIRWSIFNGYIHKPFEKSEVLFHLLTFEQDLYYREYRRQQCSTTFCVGNKIE